MTTPDRFDLLAADGARLAAYRLPASGEPRGVVQVAHGAGEHFGRYARLAGRLAAAGWAVYGQDHRGHGGSAHVHGLGDFGPRGFTGMVDDMAVLSGAVQAEQPGLPLVLLGHSMGSFLAQLYLLQHADRLAGLVLSGTAATDLLMEHRAKQGGEGGLARWNAAFEPARTPFDWLSRDDAEVDAYVADPLCGFDFTAESTQSMVTSAYGARQDARLSAVRRNLPLYVISGEFDPIVGPGQAFANALVDHWRALGFTDVEHRIYPGGRHEMFNETNREEVTDELLAWLDRAIARP